MNGTNGVRLNRMVTQIGTAGLIALLPCLAQEAMGQTGPGEGRGRAEIRQPQNPLTGARVPLYTVKFDGGTVQEYLEALRAGSSGAPLNVTCAKELLRERIGAINLEQVNLVTALNAVGMAFNDPMVHLQVMPLDFGAMEPESGAMRAFQLGQLRSDPKGLRGKEVKTFSLREYVGETRGEEAVKRAVTLISAAEAALGIDDKGDPTWVVKFHPDSGLLIVCGTPDDLAVATQVVTQLVSESVMQQQDDRRKMMMHAERERAMEVAAKMMSDADAQRKEKIAMERALQKELQNGKIDGTEYFDAAVLVKEAEENFAFRRDQYRRIEELARFGNIVQAGNSYPDTRVRELESAIVRLQQRVEELQRLLNEKANGDGAR